MILGKGAQAGTPLVLPAPPTQPEVLTAQSNPLQLTATTPPSLSQQEHKGRRGLLIPPCSAFPAVCASLGIGNNLPFATSQLAAGKQPMHPDLRHREAPAPPASPRQNHLQVAPNHAPGVQPASTAAGAGPQHPPARSPASPALAPAQSPGRCQLPAELCLPSPTSACLGRGTGGHGGCPGGAQGCRQAWARATLLPPVRLHCSIPSGTLRGAYVNTLSPKSTLSGSILSCGAGGSHSKCHLTLPAQKY